MLLSRLKTFISERARRLVDEKQLLDEADIFRLYLGALYHNHYTNVDVGVPESVTQIESPPSYNAQNEFVQTSVTKQVTIMLSSLHNQYEVIGFNRNIDRTLLSSDKEHDTSITGKERIVTPSFSLDRRVSTLKGAGDGVWLRGQVVPGTVVGFYPGIVYTPLDLRHMKDYPNVSANNTYLAMRPDNMVIDAKDYDCKLNRRAAVSAATEESLLSRKINQPSTNDVIDHPFALGQFVNHPVMPICRPNVMAFSYDVPSSIPEHLRSYIPNKYFKNHPLLYGLSDCVMRTQVLIAITHVKDQELFLNYRYNPHSELPAWYTPYNTEEDQTRWRARDTK
eukprot:CFRG7183T1